MANELPNNNAEELRPASKWTTALTKTAAVAGFAVSAATVTLGVMSIINKKEIAPGYQAKLLLEEISHLNIAEAEKSIATTGAGLTGLGVVGLASSVAAWKSASAATRARNYAQLSEQLNGKNTGQSL